VHIEGLQIVGDAIRQLSGLDLDAAESAIRDEQFTWLDLNIADANHARLRQLLVERLDFHPATYNDCIQPTPYHQPKLDEEHDYKFISFIYYAGKVEPGLEVRELNVYVGASYVITVHREPVPELLHCIGEVPEHIVKYQERAVLFLQHVLDMVMDTYRPILEGMQQRCDELELAVLSEGPEERRAYRATFGLSDQLVAMRRILHGRQALVLLRRTLTAESAILHHLVNEYNYDGAPESSLEIAIYFRDITDHIAKYLEIVESEERSLNHMMEVHSLVTNNRTNQIIYILTIMSTIMLPLNFIVGFFGMNHDDLWLIHHPYGVWIVSGVMLVVAVTLFWYFRTRRWI
jgi:magnesium transporter